MLTVSEFSRTLHTERSSEVQEEEGLTCSPLKFTSILSNAFLCLEAE